VKLYAIDGNLAGYESQKLEVSVGSGQSWYLRELCEIIILGLTVK